MSDDKTVDSLLNQLKDASAISNNVANVSENFNLPKEELEQFVINNAGRLIVECVDTIHNYKDMINSAPNAEDVSSYSDLIGATTKALESLNKIIVQDKRSNTSKELKKLDMESKKELIEHEANANLFVSTREELFRRLMDETNNPKSVSGDVIDVNDEDDPKKIS